MSNFKTTNVALLDVLLNYERSFGCEKGRPIYESETNRSNKCNIHTWSFQSIFYLLDNYTLFIYTDILHLDLGWLYICMYYQKKNPTKT